MKIVEKLKKEMIKQHGKINATIFGEIELYNQSLDDSKKGVYIHNKDLRKELFLEYTDSFKEKDYIYSTFHLNNGDYFELKENDQGETTFLKINIDVALYGKIFKVSTYSYNSVQGLLNERFKGFYKLPNFKNLYTYGGVTPVKKPTIQLFDIEYVEVKSKNYERELANFSKLFWNDKGLDIELTKNEIDTIKKNMEYQANILREQKDILDLKMKYIEYDLSKLPIED